MADSIEAIQKSKLTYLIVFIGLLFGTVLTVLVATVEKFDIGNHGFDTADMVLGLAIAGTKASAVALIFMHMNHEKKLIYWVFFGSFFFCAALAALLALAAGSPIHDYLFYK
jgi:caa(3)-type oxidase subunit IV